MPLDIEILPEKVKDLENTAQLVDNVIYNLINMGILYYKL